MGDEKFSFIAIDACLEPGPKRPFNFIGLLDEHEIKKIKNLAEASRKSKSDYIIWFGHYPTSSILTQYKESLRDVLGNSIIDNNYNKLCRFKLFYFDKFFLGKYREGLVYLCGHYHTLGGISPEMYTLQRGGFLELELADWKDNRM